MFLGAGGSGKSSLLDGLMNIRLQEAESTALADTKTVSFQWIKAADDAEDAWKEHTSADEARSLAVHSHCLVQNKRRGVEEEVPSALAPAVVTFGVAFSAFDYIRRQVTKERTVSTEFREKVSETKSAAYSQIINEAKEQRVRSQSRHNPDVMTITTRGKVQNLQFQNHNNPEVVMHVWDCGGQPVFLDVISAFLTPRTMFFLLFDASISLDKLYEEKWHHEGKVIMGREQNITHLQLMKQWLQLIHSTLIAKNDGQQAVPSSTTPSDFPRAMIVGSRRDKIKKELAKTVIDQLQSACGSAAFGDLVVDRLIVDNTKAGKGKEGEDPGYKQIRKNIKNFANSLLVPTPLAWVAFRQVLQNVSKDDPVLTYSQVSIIAESCSIANDVVPSVLHFYHQLGVMLHYINIPSLANTIIVEPQWLINQLRLLLMPAWFGHRPQHLQRIWKWLEEKGVLVEELYQEIWKDCGLEDGPQALVDLLDHFDLAKEISQCPTDMEFSLGKKYFVPCMLKARPNGAPAGISLLDGSVREAATLHITFNMGYVPPGFFVRLVAQMTKDKDFTPLLEGVVYRDSITFRCDEIDYLTIKESLESIEIRFSRKALRRKHNIHFAKACVSLRQRLFQICINVLHWLPSIKVYFAFKSLCSDRTASNCFVKITPEVHRESTLFCKHVKKFNFCKEHKYWLGNVPLQQQNVSFFIPVIVTFVKTFP